MPPRLMSLASPRWLARPPLTNTVTSTEMVVAWRSHRRESFLSPGWGAGSGLLADIVPCSVSRLRAGDNRAKVTLAHWSVVTMGLGVSRATGQDNPCQIW